ncbi:putative PurR-regulated permease PerM [Conyzicola lurida]|uniref:Putative PurR-regulated permease PerM n=1 Tax=Conyzicola lurida TaxID=1172621 RepID=A0A841AFE4_9MICO|nr:AI-2E family transporter [Conyzicola lurida]MBB5842490.1 putative PurR-regulated permease PerM [Conyzicola lurida]
MSGRAFTIGFSATVGALLAIALALAAASLGGILACIAAAGFISLGLDPLVARLEARGVPRAGGVTIVVVVFAAVLALLGWAIVPVVSAQAVDLVNGAPAYLRELSSQPWFIALDESTEGVLTAIEAAVIDFVGHPDTWLSVGGGVLQAGIGLLNGTVLGIFIVVLTLFFLGSLPAITRAVYSLVPIDSRPTFVGLAERIARSIGRYLGGMALMGVLNALFTLVLLLILGVPFAGILAALALIITMIPLVGSVVSTVIVVAISLFTSPTAALVAAVALIAYMQLEAYVLCPRIMSRAMAIPASLVLIGAMVGGSLLGLLGALVAIPVVASVVLIVNEVVVPRMARPKPAAPPDRT